MSLPKLLITRRVYDPVLDSLSGAFDIQHNQDKDEPLTKPDLIQKLADKDREGYTLVLAMRSWEFGAFEQLRR